MRMIEKIAATFGYEKRAEPSWSALAPGIGYYAGVSARCCAEASGARASLLAAELLSLSGALPPLPELACVAD